MICSATTCELVDMAEIPDSPHERLTWARERAGYRDKAHFAKVAGVNPTTYRAYENGQNGYAKLAATFAKKLGVTAEWLLEGGPLPSSEPPEPIILPPEGAGKAVIDGDAVAVTALDLSLSMGPGTLIEDFVESEPVYFDLALLQAITRTPTDRLRLVRGIGHSMEPTLRTDDRVLIDINDRAMSQLGGVYWIDYHGAHGIKRLRPAGRGRILIMSDNPVEPSFEVDADDLRIEGRAIWFARGL